MRLQQRVERLERGRPGGGLGGMAARRFPELVARLEEEQGKLFTDLGEALTALGESYGWGDVRPEWLAQARQEWDKWRSGTSGRRPRRSRAGRASKRSCTSS